MATQIEPRWTTQLALRRLQSAPLTVVTSNGAHVADLWVQSQFVPGPNADWNDYTDTMLAFKIERESHLRRIDPLLNSRWQALEEKGITHDWQPVVSLGDAQLVYDRKIFTLTNGYTVSAQVSSDGRIILEGSIEDFGESSETTGQTIQIADTAVTLTEIYQQVGFSPRSISDPVMNPLIRGFESLFARPVTRLHRWIAHESPLSSEIRHQFLQGPWRRIGTAYPTPEKSS